VKPPVLAQQRPWLVLVAPVVAAFLGVLVLHVILISRGPDRFLVVAYAVAHIGFWLPCGLYCLMRISKDSL
jgi:hypothetical protein